MKYGLKSVQILCLLLGCGLSPVEKPAVFAEPLQPRDPSQSKSASSKNTDEAKWLELDGVNGKSFAADRSYDLGPDGTIEIVFSPNDTQSQSKVQVILACGAERNLNYAIIYQGDPDGKSGRIGMIGANGDPSFVSAKLNTLKFYRVAFVTRSNVVERDGFHLKRQGSTEVFINGKRVGELPAYPSYSERSQTWMCHSNQPLLIGSYDSDEKRLYGPFMGGLMTLRLWDIPLTAEQLIAVARARSYGLPEKSRLDASMKKLVDQHLVGFGAFTGEKKKFYHTGAKPKVLFSPALKHDANDSPENFAAFVPPGSRIAEVYATTDRNLRFSGIQLVFEDADGRRSPAVIPGGPLARQSFAPRGELLLRLFEDEVIRGYAGTVDADGIKSLRLVTNQRLSHVAGQAEDKPDVLDSLLAPRNRGGAKAFIHMLPPNVRLTGIVGSAERMQRGFNAFMNLHWLRLAYVETEDVGGEKFHSDHFMAEPTVGLGRWVSEDCDSAKYLGNVTRQGNATPDHVESQRGCKYSMYPVIALKHSAISDDLLLYEDRRGDVLPEVRLKELGNGFYEEVGQTLVNAITADRNRVIRLQPVLSPGWFLCNVDNRLVVAEDDHSQQFQQASTWMVRKGLGDSQGISLESQSASGWYLAWPQQQEPLRLVRAELGNERNLTFAVEAGASGTGVTLKSVTGKADSRQVAFRWRNRKREVYAELDEKLTGDAYGDFKAWVPITKPRRLAFSEDGTEFNWPSNRKTSKTYVRPTPYEQWSSDDQSEKIPWGGTFQADQRPTEGKASFRGYNIAKLNPRRLQAETGSVKMIFAMPLEQSRDYFTTDDHVVGPYGMHVVADGSGGGSVHRQIISSAREHQSFWSKSCGFSLGVAGLSVGMDSEYSKDVSKSFSKEQMTSISMSWGTTIGMVMDRSRVKLSSAKSRRPQSLSADDQPQAERPVGASGRKNSFLNLTEGRNQGRPAGQRRPAGKSQLEPRRANDEFVERVERLRKEYVAGFTPDYAAFLNDFGTHYPYAVLYGGMGVLESQYKKEDFQKMVGTGKSQTVNAGADDVGPKFAKVSASLKLGKSQSYKTATSTGTFGEDQHFYNYGGTCSADGHWSFDAQNTLPLLLDLRPIHELLSPIFFDDKMIWTEIRQGLRDSYDEAIRNSQRKSLSDESDLPDFYEVSIDFEKIRNAIVDPPGQPDKPIQERDAGDQMNTLMSLMWDIWVNSALEGNLKPLQKQFKSMQGIDDRYRDFHGTIQIMGMVTDYKENKDGKLVRQTHDTGNDESLIWQKSAGSDTYISDVSTRTYVVGRNSPAADSDYVALTGCVHQSAKAEKLAIKKIKWSEMTFDKKSDFLEIIATDKQGQQMGAPIRLPFTYRQIPPKDALKLIEQGLLFEDNLKAK